MVNPIIYDYFQKNSVKFSLDELEEQAVKVGYPLNEIKEVRALFEEKEKPLKIPFFVIFLRVVGILFVLGSLFILFAFFKGWI